MANLIDDTYFIGDITIPNVNSSDVNDTLDHDITIYEKEILIKLLGYPLYKLMTTTPTLSPFKELIEGEEFSFELDGDTIDVKWEGLQNNNKISLISYFVYYKHREKTNKLSTGIGELLSNSENGIRMSPVQKLVNAWNRMLELYGEIEEEQLVFNGISKRDNTTYVHLDDSPSAYNYLLAKIDVFPTWIFTQIPDINEFGF